MAALAVAGAGSAAGQPVIPLFDLPVSFSAPQEPQAIAVTPPGFDLVGSGTSQTADGYPEVAVASPEYGEVWLYRNHSSPTDSDVDLEFLLDIDVFTAVGLNFFDNDVRIREITFVNLTDNDDDPDLVVALSYRDLNDNQIFRGKVASFRANRVAGVLVGYGFINAIDIAYPVTGLTTGEYSTDGRNHVLAACEASLDSGSNPSRVFPIYNTYDSVTGDYGKLWYQWLGTDDLATFPMGTNPTHNIVGGQFKQLTGGGLGGSGNQLDFVAFGAGSEGLTLGVGNGAGAFTFAMSAVDGDACGTITYGFGPGSTPGFPPTQTAAMVSFDPFSSVYKSLATHVSNTITLIHNDSRYGSFFHLCDGNASLDTYTISPVECPGEPNLTATTSYLARGRLNADPFDDLVFVDTVVGYAAMLLGRGSPGTDGRIMEFSNCVSEVEDEDHFVQYATNSTGVDLDRVLCVDLNLDGYDEILVTRMESSSLIVLPNATGQ